MINAPENLLSLSFETAIAELETIVSRLEQADVPLEQSIDLFTRGEALKLRCETLLREAEARIEKITFNAANDKPVSTLPLDAE